MTLTEFEEKVVDSVNVSESINGLQVIELTTKNGVVHNFFLPPAMEVSA